MWDAEAFRRSKCFRFTLLLFAEAFSESIMLSVLDGEEEMGNGLGPMINSGSGPALF